ncbi:MAG: CoA-binding protein [Pseudomonadota bacterium]
MSETTSQAASARSAALDPYDQAYLRRVLDRAKRIAVVGASPKPTRPSWMVSRYLKTRGYEVIPVNPAAEGQEILGRPARASLAEVAAKDGAVDMVVIFRKSEAAGAVADEALEAFGGRGLQTVWMQIGVRDEAAAARAEAAGVDVVMNRCPKMEISRFNGELSRGGFNSGVISSKRRR